MQCPVPVQRALQEQSVQWSAVPPPGVQDDHKGWGLRTLDFIPKGRFVCEYAGEVLESLKCREEFSYKQYMIRITL